MSFFEGVGKISQRLLTLRSFHTIEAHIWDIGCDHGKLGLSFNNENIVKKIYLIDPSYEVIDKLSKTLKASDITQEKIKIFHKKGQELDINESSNLIFIAGMGGQEIGNIISHLLPMLDHSSKIVISPHRSVLELRSRLHSFPVSLLHEEVILDEGTFYPIFSLKPDAEKKNKVSLFGDQIWKSELGEKYRQDQIIFFSQHRDHISKNYVKFLKSYN